MPPGDESATQQGRFDLQIRQPCRQPVPGRIQSFRTVVTTTGLETPVKPQRIQPPRRVFDPGNGHARAGRRLPEQVIQRRGRADHIMGVVEQQGIDRARQHDRLRPRLDQGHVVPAGGGNAAAGQRQHVRTLLNADHRAIGTDRIEQQRETQSGAATRVEHGIAGLQCKSGDGAPAQRHGALRAGVIAAGKAPVMRRTGGGYPCRPS